MPTKCSNCGEIAVEWDEHGGTAEHQVCSACGVVHSDGQLVAVSNDHSTAVSNSNRLPGLPDNFRRYQYDRLPEGLKNVQGELKSLKRKLAIQNRKIVGITREIEEMEEKLSRVDEVRGLLSERPACPNGVEGFYYQETIRSCYKLEPNSLLVNATQAETLCQSYGANSHLVSIESEDEQNFLRAIWKNQYGISTIARFWTSGKRRNNQWLWTSTNKKFKYEHWIPTTDHSNRQFPCMSILSDSAYFWIDVACWAPHVVTCEIRM